MIQASMPKLAAMVPTAISLMMLFVLTAAGSTIGYLFWRSSRVASRPRVPRAD
jgi:hypothetical protein